MDKIYLPKTEIELENWMRENCFNFDSYSVNGNIIHEGFGIDKSGSIYIWYYTERGERNNLKYFRLESEIVELHLIRLKLINGQKHIVLVFLLTKLR